jgi:hypothetical protein
MDKRTLAATALLVVEAAFAVLGGLVAYGLTAEYVDINATRSEAFVTAMQVGVIGLVLSGATGLVAATVARDTRVTALAVAIPALMVLAVWVTGPMAVQQKLEQQFDAVPQCVDDEMTAGPGADGARAAQETFDSIDHVGWFGGGGGSGADGCDRTLTLTERTDVVGHYEQVLEADGWTVVEEEPAMLRAEKGGRAFEVSGGGLDWTVWTGPTRGVAP